MRALLLMLLLVPALAAQEVCRTSSTTWQNFPFAAQGDSFLVEYDDTPNGVGLDAHTALAARPASAYGQLAVITRFNAVNKIDAYNGGGYAALTSVSYAAGVRYHFRLLVRVATHRFTATVTPAGGTEMLLAQDYRFRTTQDTVAALGYWVVYASRTPTHTVCNWTLTPFAPPPPPPPPPPSGSAVTAVTVVPARLSLIETQTQQLYAVVSRADGTAANGASRIVWTSSDTTVAAVSVLGFAFGQVQARGPGTATITATDSGGIAAQIPVTVRASVFLGVRSVVITNLPTPVLVQLPRIIPGFASCPCATGAYVADLLNAADSVVGHAFVTVNP